MSYAFTVDVEGHPQYQKPTLACNPDNAQLCSRTENLPVDQDFSWTVKPHGPTDLYYPNDGSASSSGQIHALLPKSSFTSYSGGPWPAKIEWEEVPGAEFYDAHLFGYGDLPPNVYQYVGEPDVDIWSNPSIAATSVEAYLDPNARWYQLALQPIGPQTILGLPSTPERGEETRDDFSFDDGPNAYVEVISPGLFYAECHEQGTMTQLTWKQVDGAEYYEVSVYEVELPFPGGDVSLGEHGVLVSQFPVPHEKGATVASTEVPSFPTTFSTPLTAGYVITIIGMSPGGRWDSYCWGDGIHGCEHVPLSGWLVQPEAPVAIAPLSGTVQEGNESTLKWSTALANGGSFYLEAYKGSGCTDDEPFSMTVQVDFSAGEIWQDIVWGEPGWPVGPNDLEKSWRVRPTGIYGPCDQSAHWSGCHSIVVNESCGLEGQKCCEKSAACNANLVCVSGTCKQCGTEGDPCCSQGQACGAGLECASGTCSVPASVVNCGQIVHAGGGGSTLAESFVVDLGGNEGTFWFAYDTVDVPDRIVVQRGDIPQNGEVLTTTDQISGVDGGCVGEQNGAPVTIGPGSNYVNITVYPNCKGTPSTAWAFLVDCLSAGAYPTAAE